MKPSVSVVVAGFGMREPSWDRVRACLLALLAQDGSESLELILCEIPELKGEVPQDIRDTVPGLKVVPGWLDDVCARKTLGARAAQAPVVAFVDGDCLPRAGWLRTVLETFEYYPEVAVVSGSMEEQEGMMGRLRLRKPGPVHQSAVNNVAFRREAFLDYPFLSGSGPDAARIQASGMRRAGYQLWFEPAMQLIRDRRGSRKPPLLEMAGRVLSIQRSQA